MRVTILEPGKWTPIDDFFRRVDAVLTREAAHADEVSGALRLGQRPHRGEEIDDPA